MPTMAAAPFPYEFSVHGLALIVIDMQRDFLEPGGFGEALGNNVAPLAAIIPTVRQLLDRFRALEAWADERNMGRQAQETPWEFAERLGNSHDLLAKPVRDLATLYARLNYAGQPLPAGGPSGTSDR